MSEASFDLPFEDDENDPGFAGPPEDLETFEDEFADDSERAVIPPVPLPEGESGFPRPNGQRYTPRLLAGMQDVAFLRECTKSSENVLLYGPPGTGKLLPLDTPIPTPQGWTTMGEISAGDEVLGRDGKPTRVSYVSDVEESPVLFDITFSDGSVITACEDHQWTVSTRDDRKASSAIDGQYVRADPTMTMGQVISTRADALCAMANDPSLSEFLTVTELFKVASGAPGLQWGYSASMRKFLLRNDVANLLREVPVTRMAGKTQTPTSRMEEVMVFDARESLQCMARSHRRPLRDPIAPGEARERTLTTREMLDAGVLEEGGGRCRFSVRAPAPLRLPEADLDVDPYVLGVWLGDGHRVETGKHAASVTSEDPEIINEVIRAGYDLMNITVDTRGNKAFEFSFRGLGTDLNALGVGRDKRIPAEYLRASQAQRLALLQGLMDTDGSISRGGGAEIALSDEGLAQDVEELLHTLGIKVTRKPSSAGYRAATGEVVECRDRHRMHFTTSQECFRLPRKARYIPAKVRDTQRWFYIASITPTDSRPGRCIQVDNDDHIYLCGREMIPTHNTALPESGLFLDAKRREDGSYEHMGMETIVCSVDTTEADFFGTFFQDPETGNFLWSPGPLQRAVMYDIPIYSDEIFLCDSRVLSSTLYPLMDGRGVLRIPMNPRLEPITVGENFCVIGAGNPDVPGANFSEALRSRFDHHIEVETDWTLARTLGVPQNVINAAKALNIKRHEGIISWSPQLRELLAFKRDRERYGKNYAYSSLLGKSPLMDRDEIEQAMHRSVPASKDSRALYLGGEYTS